MIEIERSDVMFLRNVIHGAPISVVRLASRLQRIDQLLSQMTTKPFVRDREYYERVATRIHERLQQEV